MKQIIVEAKYVEGSYMAYTKTEWKDRTVENARTFTMAENDDGTVTLNEAPGEVYEEGTPLNAENMNHIEEGIEQLSSDLTMPGIKYKSGTIYDEVSGNSYKDFTVSFSESGFTSSPAVVACIGGASTASAATSLYASTSLAIYKITSNGCRIRFFNGSNTTLSPSIQWVALGI